MNTNIFGRLIARVRLYRAAPDLLAALKESRHALYEVSHAQSLGAKWYTKGESGLYQQVNMWVKKGQKSANEAIKKAEADPYDN